MSSKSDYNLLSDREEQVLLLSTKGLTDKEIARKLGLSIATVNTYWVRIRTKLGGANRAELVAAALNKNAEETLISKEIENQRLISEVVRRAEAERALRESQHRLQAIIDGTPVIVYIKDVQGRYTLVNKGFEALVGRDRREILGKRDIDIFGPEQAEAMREQDQKVLESGESVEDEVAVTVGGATYHFLSAKFPLVNSDGIRYAICGFSRDITSRIEVEEQVQQSEKKYRALIENGADVITLLDASGNILYASASIEKVMQFTPQEMVGQNAFHYIYREDLPAIKRDFLYLQKKAGNTIEAEYRVKRKDGSFRYVQGHGKNLLEDSAVGAIVLNYRDVTESKQAELRIDAQHAVARALAESGGVQEAAPSVAEAFCGTLGFDYGAVWLLTDEDRLKLVGEWHVDRPEFEQFAKQSAKMEFGKGEGFPGSVWETAKTVWYPDYHQQDFSRSAIGHKTGLRSAIGFPIRADGKVLGIVECFSARTTTLDDEFLDVLDTIGHQIGQYVKRRAAESEELRLAKQLTEVHTELDQSIEQIQEQRRRYQDLFEQAPDGYVVTDLKGKILEANTAALDLFGCEAADCVGKALKEYVAQDLRNAFSSGLATLEGLGSIHEWELKIRPANNPVFDASVSVTAVRGSKEEPLAYRWLIRDVSKRKQLEHDLKSTNEALERRVRTRTIELEESNLRLQEEISERRRAEEDLLGSHQFAKSVIDCSIDGIIGFDRQCRFTVWNRSMEELSGLGRDEVLGQYAFELFPFLSDIGEDDFFHRALRGDTVVSQNRPYTISPTGKTGYFDAYYYPIRNERNEIEGGLAVIREVEASESAAKAKKGAKLG